MEDESAGVVQKPSNEERIIGILTDIRELLHFSLHVQAGAPWPIPFEEWRRAASQSQVGSHQEPEKQTAP